MNEQHYPPAYIPASTSTNIEAELDEYLHIRAQRVSHCLPLHQKCFGIPRYFWCRIVVYEHELAKEGSFALAPSELQREQEVFVRVRVCARTRSSTCSPPVCDEMRLEIA